MSYILPSPQVYQQLANAGGVANISPDLDAVIIGPCYNVVSYDGTSSSSLILSHALDNNGAPASLINNLTNYIVNLPSQKPGQVLDSSSLSVYFNNAVVETIASAFTATPGSSELDIIFPTASGTATTSSAVIASVTGANTKFFIGDKVTVSNYGTAGATVSTTVSSTTGNSVTVAASALTTGAVVITKNAPSYSPAAASASSAVLSGVTGYAQFVVGDNVTVTGAGVAGADLVATINAINTTSVTLDTAASTTNASSQLTKNVVSNLNSTSSTLRVEDGDIAVINYTNAQSVQKTFTTTVSSVVSTNNVVSSIFVSDILPSDVIAGLVGVHIRKVFNNQLVPGSEYDATLAGPSGTITVLPTPNLVYGLVITTDVHVAYRALRTDLSGQIQTITTTGDLVGILGSPSDSNPLSLGVELALANTITQILALAVPSDDLLGYETALQLLENTRVYSLVPLTQELDILVAVQQHCQQLSTPQMAHWRVAMVSTAIPSTLNIGPYNSTVVNANGGNSAITLVNGKYVLTVSNATFMSDGVVPGDILKITAGTGTPTTIGSHQIQAVISNQQLQINASGVATGVSYYVMRNMTKSQQATYVAANSTAFGSNRVIHCPNTAGVVVNGVTKYLPGYYFMCGVAGLVAGLPAQAGLTNIAMAGFVDVQYSNFYFTRAQMDTMSTAGTFLVVQETQGSIPYIRHEITTDMSVLQYRELQQVKNWDYLSYFFYDIAKPFIGKWNITPDSLQTLRQSLNAGGVMLKGRKLPKIGAPMVDFTIKTVAQDTANTDNVIVEMPIKMAVPMNYISLYLIV